jgi:hypothetical protein
VSDLEIAENESTAVNLQERSAGAATNRIVEAHVH